jgi:hypothetical protein
MFQQTHPNAIQQGACRTKKFHKYDENPNDLEQSQTKRLSLFFQCDKNSARMKSSRFPLGKSATSVDASGRCGEMADAQDLKKQKQHFPVISSGYSRFAYKP